MRAAWLGALLATTAGQRPADSIASNHAGEHEASLVSAMAAVQTTLQTDKVTEIPCGTSGGTVIRFERVEVVNQLRKDMVIETIRNYTIHYDRTWIFDKV